MFFRTFFHTSRLTLSEIPLKIYCVFVLFLICFFLSGINTISKKEYKDRISNLPDPRLETLLSTKRYRNKATLAYSRVTKSKGGFSRDLYLDNLVASYLKKYGKEAQSPIYASSYGAIAYRDKLNKLHYIKI